MLILGRRILGRKTSKLTGSDLKAVIACLRKTEGHICHSIVSERDLEADEITKVVKTRSRNCDFTVSEREEFTDGLDMDMRKRKELNLLPRF